MVNKIIHKIDYTDFFFIVLFFLISLILDFETMDRTVFGFVI